MRYFGHIVQLNRIDPVNEPVDFPPPHLLDYLEPARVVPEHDWDIVDMVGEYEIILWVNS